VVDLTKTTIPVITTSQPTIVGEAVPNVVVDITVNSHTQLHQQVTADTNGEFELDISQLEAELEPGDHSVQYSYVDPTSGQTVTKTKSFTVQPTVQLAQASTGRTTTTQTTTQPFGSGNPFPVGGTTLSATTPTPTPRATASASPTASSSATTSGRTSQPSTASGIPTSGSVGMTYALIIGGIFFLITGIWSFWISQQLRDENNAN
jgi:cobalamin biosynthesis Mg chelatase CobN